MAWFFVSTVYTTTIANDKPNALTVVCAAHSYPSIRTHKHGIRDSEAAVDGIFIENTAANRYILDPNYWRPTGGGVILKYYLKRNSIQLI